MSDAHRFKGKRLIQVYESELTDKSRLIKDNVLVKAKFQVFSRTKDTMDEEIIIHSTIDKEHCVCKGLETGKYTIQRKEDLYNIGSGIRYSESKLSKKIDNTRSNTNLTKLYSKAKLDQLVVDIYGLGLTDFEYERTDKGIWITISKKDAQWKFFITCDGEITANFGMSEKAVAVFKDFAKHII